MGLNGICSMGFKKLVDSYRWVKTDEFLPYFGVYSHP